MTILFPCEYENLKKVDSNFLHEYNACQTLKIDTALFDQDMLVNDNRFVSTINKSDEIVLRCWMLTKVKYFKLLNSLRDNACELINNTQQYLHCHYFPNVYKDIKEHTPNMNYLFEKDINRENLALINENRSNPLIIKDFVKSEKGTDLFKIDFMNTDDFVDFVNDFIEVRKTYHTFNEGVVFKEYVELKKDVIGCTNEWRCFFINGAMFHLGRNSLQSNDSSMPDPYFVSEVASSVKKSNFFTIDFALTESGDWIVLEVGDGQVSGLTPESNEFEFYQNLKEYYKGI